ncbi:MAG: lectin like domain-containing protein, partial [Kiritimatiellae bacterium]|nr:lectin like domain-containing protein [Kiritimatiellia bacterium]
MSAVFAATIAPSRRLPLNPDFLAWQSNRTAGVVARSTAGMATAGGYRPSPFDLRDVAAAYAARMATNPVARAFASIPSAYDSRERGWVSPVKDQGRYGTCWAHATMAALESWILKEDGVCLDFSENNLVNRSGFDGGFDVGGNGNMAAAYLLRWGGPVLEATEPYAPPSSIGASVALPPVRHVQNVRWLLPRDNAMDNNAIKQAVMDCGAVMTDCYYDDGWRNSSTGGYYYPGEGGQNHAVTIVGWDDDYPVSNFRKTGYTPAGNGAFIVKNSWGTSWGNEGYLYISYYDGALAKNTSYAFPSAEPVGNYGKIYEYDPLGAVGRTGYGNETGWMANVFTATEGETLAAVGFYMVSPNTEYEVYVYKNCKAGDPRTGTLLCSQRGIHEHAGYVTLTLPQGVEVAAGEKFSVVVSVVSPGATLPLALEWAVAGYSSAATAHVGESFINLNPDNNYLWQDVSADGENCCIKVYTAGGKSDEVRNLYVDAASTATNPDGLTWQTAFADLRDVVPQLPAAASAAFELDK